MTRKERTKLNFKKNRKKKRKKKKVFRYKSIRLGSVVKYIPTKGE